MEDEIHADHGVQQALRPAHVADIELQLGVIVVQPHVVLFLFIAAEDANFRDVGIEKAVEHSIAKSTGAASDEKSLVCEHRFTL